MKQCIICSEGLKGYGRYLYCLECGEMIKTYYCEHSKEGYIWAIGKVKEIVEQRKIVGKKTGGDILSG